MVLKEVKSLQDYYNAKALSMHGNVFLMKYGNGPGSENAYKQFEGFAKHHEDIACFALNINDQKQVSDRVAGDTGVKHESPQAILLRNEKVAWSADREHVTIGNMEHALGQ